MWTNEENCFNPYFSVKTGKCKTVIHNPYCNQNHPLEIRTAGSIAKDDTICKNDS